MREERTGKGESKKGDWRKRKWVREAKIIGAQQRENEAVPLEHLSKYARAHAYESGEIRYILLITDFVMQIQTSVTDTALVHSL